MLFTIHLYENTLKKLSEYPLVNLGIGELALVENHVLIQTVLGSCVSTVMWVPSAHFSMISHAIYPTLSTPEDCDCRYVSCCIEKMNKEITKRGISKSKVTVKIFGGSILLDQSTITVGNDVVEQTVHSLLKHGFTIDVQETGGNLSRKLIFNSSTGDVYIKKLSQ